MSKASFRRVFACVMGILLLLLACASVARESLKTEEKVTFSMEGDALSGIGVVGYETRLTQDGLHCERVSPDAALFVSYTAPAADAIYITLAEPLGPIYSDGGWEIPPSVAFASEGEEWNEQRVSYLNVVSEDGLSYRFFMPEGNTATHFSLRLGDAFTLRAIRHEQGAVHDTVYAFRPIAAALLLLLTALLVIFEKKLHFFATVRDFAKKMFTFSEANTPWKKLLRGTFLLCLVAFLGVALSDLALSLTAAKAGVLLWVLALLLVALLLSDRLLLKQKPSFAALFFGVGMILGTTLVLTLPSACGLAWDDGYHFAFVSGPASFLTGGTYRLSLDTVVRFSPHFPSYFGNTEMFAQTLLRLDGAIAPMPKLALPDLHPALLCLLAPFGAVYGAYRYLAYFPAILGATFALAFRGDVIFLISLARLFNMLLYVGLFTLAIRRLKYGKRLFAMVALLPSSLFLAASFSCDGFITAFISLGFAYFIGELQRPEETLSRKNAIIMCLAIALGCSAKPIYFVLLFPLLFLPNAKMKSEKGKRQYRIAVLLSMVLVAMTFVLPFLLNNDAYTDLRGGSDVSTLGQISYILKNPLSFLDTFFRFLGDYISLPSSTRNLSLFGYLGFGTTFLSSLFLVLLLYFAFTDRKRDPAKDLSLHGGIRTVSLLTLFAAVALVIVSLYVGFTPVGHPTVNGCQFRYLFPLFAPILFFLGASRIRSYASERATALLSLGGGALINLLFYMELIIKHLAVQA